jgi:hypothetical protein
MAKDTRAWWRGWRLTFDWRYAVWPVIAGLAGAAAVWSKSVLGL